MGQKGIIRKSKEKVGKSQKSLKMGSKRHFLLIFQVFS